MEGKASVVDFGKWLFVVFRVGGVIVIISEISSTSFHYLGFEILSDVGSVQVKV